MTIIGLSTMRHGGNLVSDPTIMIIEPNLEFSKILSRELKDLGYQTIIKTDVSDPDQLIRLPQNIITIVLNLELRSIEGLTIYSYLKNHKKFRNCTFSFLADDDNTFFLLDNMPLDRAIVLRKESKIKSLVSNIIDNIEYSVESTEAEDYSLDIAGKLEQICVSELIKFCEKTYFSGKLVLNHHNNFAIFIFDKGESISAKYKNLSLEDALSEIQSWYEGNFRLERLKYNITQMLNIVNFEDSINPKINEIELDISDLFLDVFSFLYTFLSNQVPGGQVNYIYQEGLQAFHLNNPSKKTFIFSPYSDEKIHFENILYESDIKPNVDLFKQIFSTAKSYHPEIELNDLLQKLNELEPYLNKINFFNLLLNEDKLIEISDLYQV